MRATTFDDALRRWAAVEIHPPGALRDARLQSHWAAQLLAATARERVPHRDDFAHLALTWLDPLEMLVGEPTRSGHRVALRLRDLTLAVLDADDRPEWRYPLDGRTLQEGARWIAGVLAVTGEPALDLDPLRDRDGLPPHPVADGAAFALDESLHFAELSRWYGNVAALLAVVSLRTLGASPVRCWPHHFDVATLIHLDEDEDDAEVARSINVGMSPGDGDIDEPYLYVTPWPRPDGGALPTLEGEGRWHQNDWCAAVLPACRLPAPSAGDPDHHAQEQAEVAYRFLRSALGACREILGAL